MNCSPPFHVTFLLICVRPAPTAALKPDKCDVMTNRAPPPTDNRRSSLPTYHPWPPPIESPRPHSYSAGIIHPRRASESPPPLCTVRRACAVGSERPNFDHVTALGTTTRQHRLVHSPRSCLVALVIPSSSFFSLSPTVSFYFSQHWIVGLPFSSKRPALRRLKTIALDRPTHRPTQATASQGPHHAPPSSL
jgi:hypothetical protein